MSNFQKNSASMAMNLFCDAAVSVQFQVIFDLFLAFGSFCFIAVFMRLQTGSFWVTGFAILSILTSFAGTNLIYRLPFFSVFLHFLRTTVSDV